MERIKKTRHVEIQIKQKLIEINLSRNHFQKLGNFYENKKQLSMEFKKSQLWISKSCTCAIFMIKLEEKTYATCN